MRTRRWLRAASSLVVLALASPVLDCGARAPVAPPPPRCPNVADDAAVLAFDWAGAYALDAATANELARALAAAIEMKKLAAHVDADLETGCGGLAADLGATGNFESGKDACDAAARALRDTVAKLGKAKIALDASAPRCGAPMDVLASCAAHCDAPRDAPTCETGKLQGTCTGACTGACDVQSGAKCTGTCSGKCDGKCKGKCDGVASRGVCAGTCDGACSGACTGACELRAASPCNGTCTGACDAEIQSPRCAGAVASHGSAACVARCNARAEASATCTPARVGVTIKAADKALAKKLKTALEKDLPLVLQISTGMRDRLKQLAADAKTLLESADARATSAPLAACVGPPLREGVAASVSLDASLASAISVHMP